MCLMGIVCRLERLNATLEGSARVDRPVVVRSFAAASHLRKGSCNAERNRPCGFLLGAITLADEAFSILGSGLVDADDWSMRLSRIFVAMLRHLGLQTFACVSSTAYECRSV
jgi:hypothetical protein